MRKILFILSIVAAIGTHAQTPQLVYDINPGSNSSFPIQLTSFNDKIYCAAYSVNVVTREMLSHSDAGVNMNEFSQYVGVNIDLSYPNYKQNMIVFNNKMYFSGKSDPNIGYELMAYDGINPPTLVADIISGSSSSVPREFYSFNDKLFFCGGGEMYIYDGTNPPINYNVDNPRSFIELNGKVYFVTSSNFIGNQMFVYDPSTNLVTSSFTINPSVSGGISSNIIRYDNKLYFTALDTTYDFELFSYDGVSPTRITNFSNFGGAFHLIGVYNNELYFVATDDAFDKLYKHNATTGSTTLVNNVEPTRDAGVVYAGKLYFVGDDGIHGDELWVQDGNNTYMVADLAPGSSSGVGTGTLCVHNNALFFSGGDFITGGELYSFKDPLSIQNTKLNGEITLSPNPTTNNATLKLSLQTPNELSIALTDATGKLVWEKAATNFPQGNTDILLPIENNAAGVYFYNVKDNTGSIMSSGKLVKQ